MLMENFSPWGVVCPCPGAIYVYFHNNETSSPLKPLGQSKPNFIIMEHPLEGGKKVYINGQLGVKHQ